MVYQRTILHTSRTYKGNCWLSYDTNYRRQAAACKSLNWAQVDFTLYNETFAGVARPIPSVQTVPVNTINYMSVQLWWFLTLQQNPGHIQIPTSISQRVELGISRENSVGITILELGETTFNHASISIFVLFAMNMTIQHQAANTCSNASYAKHPRLGAKPHRKS